MSKKTSFFIAMTVCGLFAISFMADSCSTSQSSFNNQQTAINKWGQPGNSITNFYEYQQLQAIYALRDNPKLIMNAYLYSDVTGKLSCLGRVKGFGIPYGTELSPPSDGTQPVPEPNSLYPSQSTNADWIQLIGPDGRVHITFVEPNLVITDLTLPCVPL